VVAVTQEAIRVCGERAFLRRYPLERYARDARAAALMRPWTPRSRSSVSDVLAQVPRGHQVGRTAAIDDLGAERDDVAVG
jgi:hypothetical protein